MEWSGEREPVETVPREDLDSEIDHANGVLEELRACVRGWEERKAALFERVEGV